MKKEEILIRAVTVEDISDILRLRRFMLHIGFADSVKLRVRV